MLTRQQIDEFHRDGLLVIKGVFRDSELEALQRAADQVQEDGIAGSGDGHGYRNVNGKRQYYRTDGVLWQRDRAFRTATMDPGLLAAVGQCLGHAFMPINDSLVVKLPHSDVSIPWHQDPPYQGPNGRQTTFEIPNFDCDIYLDEANLQNGCLFGLAGHHLAGHVEVERFQEEDLFDRADALPLEMAPGDVLLHAITAPHGSKANRSDTLRRVFYVHYMAREVLEGLHPDWIGTKRGFGDADVKAARSMIAERTEAGWSTPDSQNVELTPNGFAFRGEPITPRRHWGALIADLPPDEIRAAKTLTPEPVSGMARAHT
jgi:phytanoyl-CoA hydroxylase